MNSSNRAMVGSDILSTREYTSASTTLSPDGSMAGVMPRAVVASAMRAME